MVVVMMRHFDSVERIQLVRYNEQWGDLLNMPMSLRFVQRESESQIFKGGSDPGPATHRHNHLIIAIVVTYATHLWGIMYWIVLVIL
jgi:hypothetical protein